MGTPEIIELPGLIDMHVHLRGMPSDAYKETFESGTKAAIAGGITTVVDMPNNKAPYRTNTFTNLTMKRALMLPHPKGPEGVYSDAGVYFGYQPDFDNLATFEDAMRLAMGFKGYLEPTNENNTLHDPKNFKPGVRRMREIDPYALFIAHTEDETIEDTLGELGDIRSPIHIAHVSTRFQLDAIMRFRREKEYNITCEFAPHHGIATRADRDIYGFGAQMKPDLAEQEDQDYLWYHKDEIDAIATDHAPHAPAEKPGVAEMNAKPEEAPKWCNGIPGLEVSLAIGMKAVKDGRLTLEELVDKMHTAPARILRMKPDPRNRIKVLMEEYEFGDRPTFSKASYDLYVGRPVVGRVVEVELHGQPVFVNGRFVNDHGTGRVLYPGFYPW